MFLVGPKTKNTFLHFDTAALERPNLPPRARSASGRLRCATSEVAVAAPFVVVSPPPALVSNMGKADDDGEQSTAAGSSELCAASEGGRESCRDRREECEFRNGGIELIMEVTVSVDFLLIWPLLLQKLPIAHCLQCRSTHALPSARSTTCALARSRGAISSSARKVVFRASLASGATTKHMQGVGAHRSSRHAGLLPMPLLLCMPEYEKSAQLPKPLTVFAHSRCLLGSALAWRLQTAAPCWPVQSSIVDVPPRIRQSKESFAPLYSCIAVEMEVRAKCQAPSARVLFQGVLSLRHLM
mmetsp:Transcript_3982/g.14835  ORF Transcript_3982/g.14835 Transcript_3982/m.14835 type:complete len:299 (-) Transcript_3982:85-981(-)